MLEGKLTWTKYGNGEKVVLAFHGFGQHRSIYEKLGEKVENVSVYSFDLFFHGSNHLVTLSLSKRQFSEAIEHFLEEHGITRFSIIAYSIGVRSALAIVEKFPVQVEELVLLAPDGIRTNAIYKIATGTRLGNLFFKHLIENTHLILSTLDLFYKRNWLDKETYKVAYRLLSDPFTAHRVYNAWMVYRKFTFDTQKIASILNQYQIPVKIILGAKDSIIPAKPVQNFAKLLRHCQCQTVPGGHIYLLQQFLRTHAALLFTE
ncbi:alpha/beta hydrolase [Rapidithrix thailandica]|uniref:Alpha/beta hydrolase n=1 Tax=Rapidithrix thailandica TaxID=413964 RepID=A0AAW9SAX0_9BACT